jgi:RHS repeat-associated protein
VVDLKLFGSIGNLPLNFTRYSNTRAVPQNAQGVFGRESVWTHSYQWLMRDGGIFPGQHPGILDLDPHRYVRITLPDGSDYTFVNSLTLAQEQVYTGSSPVSWLAVYGLKATLKQTGDVYTLLFPDGSRYFFTQQLISNGEVTGKYYRLTSFEDNIGNEYELEYLSGTYEHKLVSKISDASGRYLELSYSNQAVHASPKVTALGTANHAANTLGQWFQVNVTNASPARYLTLIDRNYVDFATPLQVAEIEFYDENNNLISGTPFGASPYHTGSSTPASAFDGNTSTNYQYAYSLGGYVGIDCGTAKTVSSIRYFIPSGGPSASLEFAGYRSIATGNYVVSQVTGSDGRSVSYNYATVTDPSGLFSWNTLSRAAYADSSTALYSYAQTEPFSRPLMIHSLDPRIIGKGVAIEYTYSPEGPIGYIKEERSGIQGTPLGSTSFESPQKPMAVYLGGRMVKYDYSATLGVCLIKEDGRGNKTFFDYDAKGFTSEVTDRRGFVTTIVNNALGLPTSTTYPDGAVHQNTYDSRGRLLTKSISGSGITTRTTTYTRDGSGRINAATHPDGSTEAWTYNSFGQPLTHTRKNGEVEYLSYDITGRCLSFTNAAGKVTTLTYDSLDRVASVTDPLNRTTSFLYNERGKVIKQTHPDATWVEFEYDDADNLITRIDELGNVWSKTYDELRNVLTETDPLGRTTTYSYADNSPGACGTCQSGGKPALITTPAGRQIRFTYDLEWNLISSTVAPGTVDEATTQYAYDQLGNLIQTLAPGGSNTTHTYDNRNRQLTTTDPLGRVLTMTYNRAGNMLTEKRPNNGITSYTYDLADRILSITDPKSQTTSFTYDAEGNKVSLTDARSHTYSWVFDELNNPTRANYPNSSYEAWTYDDAGQRIISRSRNGAIATSTFDQRGRETSIDWSDSTPDVVRTFDAVGRLLTSANSGSTSSYTYDYAGQQLSETQYLNGIAPSLPAYTVSYTYDLDGNRATVTYPGSSVVSYTYTGRNQVETISEGAPPPLAGYTYNVSGTRASRALENGVVTGYSYDAAYQLTGVSHSVSAVLTQTRAYQYNNVGNRTAMQVDGGSWDVYGYDAVDQITSAKYQASSSGGASPQRSVSYDWDAVGNREQVQDVPAVGSTVTDVYATANSVNQYPTINGSTVTHDNNGNLTAARLLNASANPVSSLSYDSQNRLLSVQNGSDTVTSTYDTRNRVTSRTINSVTTYFLWDNWNLIEERDASGSQIRRYVHGADVDELLMMVDTSGGKYYQQDALGNVTAITDDTGAIIESYLYDVFGKATILDATSNVLTTTVVNNRFLYTGREYIAEAGIYDYRNRVYSPVLGRFLQTDPIRFKAGDVNIYRYVNNNSGNYTDPNGLSIIGAIRGLAGAIFASIGLGTVNGAGSVIGELFHNGDAEGIHPDKVQNQVVASIAGAVAGFITGAIIGVGSGPLGPATATYMGALIGTFVEAGVKEYLDRRDQERYKKRSENEKPDVKPPNDKPPVIPGTGGGCPVIA